MLEVVDELERTGTNLQHFCRELARYFRNLLVAQNRGRRGTDAVDRGRRSRAGSGWREIAREVSEEDLTRWLQLAIEMFKELQYSLQPRLHLELGLLRLVQAGTVEADRGSAGGIWRRRRGHAPPPAPPLTARSLQASVERASGRRHPRVASLRERLPSRARAKERPPGPLDASAQFGDCAKARGAWSSSHRGRRPWVCAAPTSSATWPRRRGGPESEADHRHTAPGDAAKAATGAAGSGTPAAAQPGVESAEQEPNAVAQRALANPEVQRFQELFPKARCAASAT